MNAETGDQKRYFTLEEANRRLPLVRAIVEDIVTLFRDVHDRRQRLLRIRQSSGKAGHSENNLYEEEVEQVERDLDKDIARLDGYVRELHDLGAELKDYATGLVDFLTRIDGKDAYLCWRRGEEEIGYWHELDAGVQGRQSLFEKSVPGEDSAGEKLG
ncbi:MAG: DUF2203 domain-containing protein [Planctomycetaceae bacterium]